MSEGLYTITTRAAGSILTAAIYNSDHQNHVTNDNPSMMGAFSDDEIQMQIQNSPGIPGTPNLAVSMADELAAIRYVLAQILGETYWYSPVTTNLANAGPTTGDITFSYAAAKTGWVIAADGSIGDASSGASERANADCQNLFELLWTNISNTWAPVSGGRGLSNTADWAAHKTITLPKALGRAMGIAGTGSGLTARVLGQVLGEETHSLTAGEIPNLTIGDGTFTVGATSGGQFIASGSGTEGKITNTSGNPVDATGATVTVTGLATNNTGSGAHNNMQPTTFSNMFIKL